jgi:hypothetical protein
MTNHPVVLLSSVAVFSIVFLLGQSAWAEPTIEQQKAQETNEFSVADPADGELTVTEGDPLAEILPRFQEIARYFELLDEPTSEDRQQELLKKLRAQSDTAGRAIELYKILSEAASSDNDHFGEARWRALYLLGELQSEEAVGFLADIALLPLPKPGALAEQLYRIEYRLRARAIDGLEKAGATDSLARIYESGELVSGMAAAALFELGRAPDGIVALDPEQVIGPGDPKDYNPARGTIGDRLPLPLPASPGEPDKLIPGGIIPEME